MTFELAPAVLADEPADDRDPVGRLRAQRVRAARAADETVKALPELRLHERDRLWASMDRVRLLAFRGATWNSLALSRALLSYCASWRTARRVKPLPDLRELHVVTYINGIMRLPTWTGLVMVAPELRTVVVIDSRGIARPAAERAPPRPTRTESDSDSGRDMGPVRVDPSPEEQALRRERREQRAEEARQHVQRRLAACKLESITLNGHVSYLKDEAGALFRSIPSLRTLDLTIALWRGEDLSALVNQLGLPLLSSFRLAAGYEKWERMGFRQPLDSPVLDVDLRALMPDLNHLHLDFRATVDDALATLPVGLESLHLGRHVSIDLASAVALLQRGSPLCLRTLKQLTFDIAPPGFTPGERGTRLPRGSTPLALAVDAQGEPVFDLIERGWERPTWTDDYTCQGVRELITLARGVDVELKGMMISAVELEDDFIAEERVARAPSERYEEGELGREWTALPAVQA